MKLFCFLFSVLRQENIAPKRDHVACNGGCDEIAAFKKGVVLGALVGGGVFLSCIRGVKIPRRDIPLAIWLGATNCMSFSLLTGAGASCLKIKYVSFKRFLRQKNPNP
jgi:hypothetical protein